MRGRAAGGVHRGARRALVASVLLAGALAASGPAAFAEQPKRAASPIYGVTIPPGYRKWEMVAPADEAAPLDELRVVLGNPVAIRAGKRHRQRRDPWLLRRGRIPTWESGTIRLLRD